jgi:hypothetical protein
MASRAGEVSITVVDTAMLWLSVLAPAKPLWQRKFFCDSFGARPHLAQPISNCIVKDCALKQHNKLSISSAPAPPAPPPPPASRVGIIWKLQGAIAQLGNMTNEITSFMVLTTGEANQTATVECWGFGL